MRTSRSVFWVCVFAWVLVGCSSPPVQETVPDTFREERSGAGPTFEGAKNETRVLE